MKRRFSLPFARFMLSLSVCSAFFCTAIQAKAENDTDLRDHIQQSLPDGEKIQAFLQLSPRQAWLATIYSRPNSIQTSACSLSFVRMNDSDTAPAMASSLSLLTTNHTGKLRAFNRSWTLPLESEGRMTLKNSGVNQTFTMVAASPSVIEGDISALTLQRLLNGLAYGQEIWQSFSLGDPQSLPTARIVPIVNQFKQCSEDNNFVNLGGPLDPRAHLSDNPF